MKRVKVGDKDGDSITMLNSSSPCEPASLLKQGKNGACFIFALEATRQTNSSVCKAPRGTPVYVLCTDVYVTRIETCFLHKGAILVVDFCTAKSKYISEPVCQQSLFERQQQPRH